MTDKASIFCITPLTLKKRGGVIGQGKQKVGSPLKFYGEECTEGMAQRTWGYAGEPFHREKKQLLKSQGGRTAFGKIFLQGRSGEGFTSHFKAHFL